MLLHDSIIPVTEYKSLLSDDDTDIVFSGKSRNGNLIIGSIIEDDYDSHSQRFYHLIVSKEDLELFTSSKITYLELFKKSDKIFVVTRSYTDLRPHMFTEISEYDFEDLDKSTLPLENSYI